MIKQSVLKVHFDKMRHSDNYHSPEKSKDSDGYRQDKDQESKLSKIGIIIPGGGVSSDNIIYRSLDNTWGNKLGNIHCHQHKKSKQHLKGGFFIIRDDKFD